MAVQYKCHDSECAATDFEPLPVTAFEDRVPMAVCGRCGKQFPKPFFKRVRG
jgi:hypothetical protein